MRIAKLCVLMVVSVMGCQDPSPKTAPPPEPVNQQNLAALQSLADCVNNGKPEQLKILLERGANPNIMMLDGSTVLHGVSGMRRQGASECVHVLLDGGAVIDLQDVRGRTPLHVACSIGVLENVKLLLAAGARVDLRDAEGHTPVECVDGPDRSEIVRLLTAQSPSVRQP